MSCRPRLGRSCSVTMSFNVRLIAAVAVCLVWLPPKLASGGVASVDLYVDATLVWGVKERSENSKLKPAGEDMQAKLRKSLKWEHYYEITNKSFSLAGFKSHRVRMSKKCEVEVNRVGDSEVVVKLIGEGKVVVNRRASLLKDDAVVLGGPCEDQSAWLVVLNFK